MPSTVFRLLALLLCFNIVATTLAADTLLNLEAPLSKPKKESARSEGAADKVPVAVWIPDGVPVLRGAFVNPFYVKAAGQRHWQAACRQWGFAVVGANYFGVPNTEFGPSLAAALKEAAAKSEHPELENVPLLFGGMSAGAGMSVNFAAALPERTIAVGPVCLEVGPRSPASRQIPIVTIFGDKDGKQLPLLTEKLPLERAEHAQWAIAPQWGRGHEYGKANNLVLPFFNRVITARLPGLGSATGDNKLTTLKEETGWLADIETWKEPLAAISSYAEYPGDKTKAAWLPDKYTAYCWRAFVAHKPALKIIYPAAQGDGAEFAVHSAKEPLVVKFEIGATAGNIASVELFDGDVTLARQVVSAESKSPLEFLPVNTLTPGIKALHVIAYDATGKPVATSGLSAIVVK